AAFVFRRFLALGFSKRRCRRTCSIVCSRSSFFLNRRSAFSTGSPFFNLTSVIRLIITDTEHDTEIPISPPRSQLFNSYVTLGIVRGVIGPALNPTLAFATPTADAQQLHRRG